MSLNGLLFLQKIINKKKNVINLWSCITKRFVYFPPLVHLSVKWSWQLCIFN